MCKIFWLKSLKERGYWKDTLVEERIILKQMLG